MSKKKQPRRNRFWLFVVGGIAAILAVLFALRGEIVASRARASLSERDLDSALWWLNVGKRISPKNAECEFLLARLARKKSDVVSMREHLSKAGDLGYSPKLVQREMWLALAQSGSLRDAEPHLHEMFRDQQGDGREICEAFVLGYLSVYRLDEARGLLAEWINGFPDDPQPYFLRGIISSDQQDWKPAEEDLRMAIQCKPDHMAAHLGLANVLTEIKRPEEAIQHYRIASTDKEVGASASVGLAVCLDSSLDQTDEALKVLQEVLEKDPINVEALVETAKIQFAAGNYQQTYDLLAPVVSQHSRDFDLRHLYATALSKVGKKDEAKEEFAIVRKAKVELDRANKMASKVTLAPSDIDLRLEVAQIYLKYSSEREGLLWYWSVLDIDPDNRSAHLALAEYYEAKKPASASDRENARFHRRKSGNS